MTNSSSIRAAHLGQHAEAGQPIDDSPGGVTNASEWKRLAWIGAQEHAMCLSTALESSLQAIASLT